MQCAYFQIFWQLGPFFFFAAVCNYPFYAWTAAAWHLGGWQSFVWSNKTYHMLMSWARQRVDLGLCGCEFKPQPRQNVKKKTLTIRHHTMWNGAAADLLWSSQFGCISSNGFPLFLNVYLLSARWWEFPQFAHIRPLQHSSCNNLLPFSNQRNGDYLLNVKLLRN